MNVPYIDYKDLKEFYSVPELCKLLDIGKSALSLVYSLSSCMQPSTNSRSTALLVLPCASQYALNAAACSFLTRQARLAMFSR